MGDEAPGRDPLRSGDAVIVLLSDAEPLQAAKDRRWIGTTNPPLSESGQELAWRAAELLSGERFDHVYVSALRRAMTTADIVMRGRGERSIVPALDERSFGLLEDRTHRESMNEFPRRKWLEWEREYFIRPPDGESMKQVEDRVLPFLKTMILPYPDKRFLVISHRIPMMTMIGYLRGMDEAKVVGIQIESGIPYYINPYSSIPA
jgi:broad specificity phosphatase PhoE